MSFPQSRQPTAQNSSLPSIDKRVLAAIQSLFPDGAVPDEQNYMKSGDQHKAPDHSVLDGQVLIERKSLNRTDSGQIYSRFKKISDEQGSTIRAIGIVNSSHLICQLPNRKNANLTMTDYLLSPLDKAIGAARNKFTEHAIHHAGSSCTRMVIISDHSEMELATDSVEYFIGKKFIRNRKDSSQTGPIDCILYVKDPPYVMDLANSYWFKCLVNADTNKGKQDAAQIVSMAIFTHLRNCHPPEWENKFKLGQYRPLLA